MLCHREMLNNFVLLSLLISNSVKTLLSLLFSICWGGEERWVVSFLVSIFISVPLTLFVLHFSDNEGCGPNLVPYFIESKILSVVKCAIFDLPLRKKKQCCLNYNAMLSYHLEFLLCTYQKNSFRLRHIFYHISHCANRKSKT